MNKRNRWKYTGVAVGAGLAVVLFSSGVYANTSPKKEDEVQVISFDASENSTEETVESEMFSTAESSESFSSETILTEGTEIVPESTTELENTQENSELSTKVGEVLDNVEETDAEKIDTDFGLSA